MTHTILFVHLIVILIWREKKINQKCSNKNFNEEIYCVECFRIYFCGLNCDGCVQVGEMEIETVHWINNICVSYSFCSTDCSPIKLDFNVFRQQNIPVGWIVWKRFCACAEFAPVAIEFGDALVCFCFCVFFLSLMMIYEDERECQVYTSHHWKFKTIC